MTSKLYSTLLSTAVTLNNKWLYCWCHMTSRLYSTLLSTAVTLNNKCLYC